MPSGLEDFAGKVAGVGGKMASPQNSEAAGIKARKANVDEYMKAVGDEKATPKAPSPQPAQAVDKIHPRAKYGDRPTEKRFSVSDMVKPLGSFAMGTDYVPKTGPYTLHEGEKVTPAKGNRMDFSNIVESVKNASAKGSKARTEAGKLGDAFTQGHEMGERAAGNRPAPTEKKGLNKDVPEYEVPSYKDGIAVVPKTGPAILHKGEKVTPAKENMADMFDKVPGRKEEKPPKKSIKRIEITKSHNGKHIVKHVHHHPAHEDETHVMNDMAALHSHLEDHAGTPNEGEGQESAPAGAPAGGPAQLAASAPAAPGAEPTAVPGA